MGDLVREVLALDWPGAFVAGAIAMLVGGVVMGAGVWLGERAVDASPGAPPRAATWFASIGRRVRGDPEPDRSRWLCGECHSWNPAGSTACSSGCGAREGREPVVPEDPEPAGRQRGGRAARRG